jgi:hypothetical protein
LEYLILSYGVSASCLSIGIRTVLVLIEVSKQTLLLYFRLTRLFKDLETSREPRSFLKLLKRRYLPSSCGANKRFRMFQGG